MTGASERFLGLAAWLRDFHSRLRDRLERADGTHRFLREAWERPTLPGAFGGYGETAVLEDGALFERGGVNLSVIEGTALPPAASARWPELAAKPYRVAGVSVVLHPRNPYCPTSHMNIRSFECGARWWFGGGFDLTPYYPFHEDVLTWHRAAKSACEPFGSEAYGHFKQACDGYFFLKHRSETRGVGGIFYDDLNDEAQPVGGDFAACEALMHRVGEAYGETYLSLLEKRKHLPYGARERNHQLLRRGRYVEFNLVYDRGTHFGLQSGGRTEAILMSMPPEVRWSYDHQPEPGSPEAQLGAYLRPRDWLSEDTQ